MSDDVPAADATPFEVHRIPNEWIDLRDGTRLAARIWRPVTEAPVPAVLEYLPYRKADGMAARDEPLGRWFAQHGYAWVRVDIRGTGDSDGIITDEYSQQEQDDALEVIDWIASRPWCTGAIGMIGISWGGFNGLQVAARRPPALKAVISMCSTDDRYADDVHYDGGCLLAWDMVPWHAVMFAWNALPPHPWTVGDGWRDTWLRRLEHTPPFVTEWMRHQRRDAYWKHGSVCEDYGAIAAPVWMVGGWADGYTNAIGRTVAGLHGIRNGLIGPWAHSWPHTGEPGPRIGFLRAALRWWDRWLRDEANGVESEPLLRAWMQERVAPDAQHLDRPGRWVSEGAWPPSSVEPRRLYLDGRGRLVADAEQEAPIVHAGVLRHGMLAGTWCPYGRPADFPPDQREDDALCLTFETDPLPERLELLGHPRLRLTVAVDRPLALVVARLCDVAPDGTSLLLSRGALNLTHRDSHERPDSLEPGKRYEVDLELDVLGQAVPAEHRLRLALSTTYWPWLWPSPEAVALTVTTGAGSWLDLPIRRPGADDGPDPAFAPPERPAELALERSEEVPAFHRIERDIAAGVITMTLNQDGDRSMRFPDGMELAEEALDRFTIREGDPLSATVACDRSLALAKADWRVRVRTHSEMTSDATLFRLRDTLEAFEGDALVFSRTWDRSIPRDLV